MKREQDHADQGVAFVGIEGEGQVSVDTLLGQRTRRVSKSKVLLPLRDWRMSAKLAILVFVPTVVAVLLGVIGMVAVSSGGVPGASLGVLVALAVVLTIGLVATGVVGYTISKRLVDSLHRLRASATDVANDKLPSVVQHIQERGETDAEIEPVPLRGDDEIGQVARAFDQVHQQAIRLATEQVAMRTAYGNVFVNLSRRSQSLVQRQLQLIEQLERDEEDSEQLGTLFQLDHLATRMRRNNENLLVLSGGESGRRPGQPVTVTDVLRAAVSEIEQYQRVAVKTAPDTRVVGHAASDLMRLIAELLDNATAFSAPETHVTLATRLTTERSLSIDVIDKGIGMNAVEVDEANSRMAEAASMDLSGSRRMGLFVVGRLAGKHGFRVTIHGGSDVAGVRANIVIPENLLSGRSSVGPLPTRQPGSTRTRVGGASAAAELPRRNRHAGGSAVGAAAFVPQEPAPTTNEASGTALFTPIESSDASGEQGQRDAAETGSDAHTFVPDQVDSLRAEPTQADFTQFEAAQFEPMQPGPTEAAPGERAGWPEPPSEVTGSAPVAETPETSAGSKDDLPVGTALFASNDGLSSDDAVSSDDASLTQWWTAAARASEQVGGANNGSGERVPSPEETTPIFNEMLSAWFRSDAEEDAGRQDGAVSAYIGWDFAADQGRRTVESVSRAEPSSYTESGLPRRRKGERLLPGSAAESAAQPTATNDYSTDTGTGRKLPIRNPADVGGRLSKFQQGIQRGKQDSNDSTEPAGTTATGPVPAQPQRGQVDDSDTAWNFASDEDLRQVHSASDAQPSSYTESGLPRRRRGEKLVPGSATQPEAVPGPRSERDAESVRGRLSSFQHGVRKGRHQSAQPRDGQPADGRDNHEHMEGE